MKSAKLFILVRGLGGTGKTTLSRGISLALGIPVFNRDDVKQALHSFELGPEREAEIGYAVMNELAKVQLQQGISVVLDANSRFHSMQVAYEKLAIELGATFKVITCRCLIEIEWEQRIKSRGRRHPICFSETKSMPIEDYDGLHHLILDTSRESPEKNLRLVLDWLGQLK